MFKNNKRIILIIIIGAMIFTGIIGSKLYFKNEDIKFPYEFEVNNYNIEIEYAKLYDNYLLTKHKIRKKDGSNIEKDEANLSTFINRYSDGYIFGPQIISTKIIDNKVKEEISIDFIAAVKEPVEKLKVKHSLAGKNIDRIKEIKKDGIINLSNENYESINKKIKVDDTNLTVMDLGHFEFGSILNLFTENLKDEKLENFDEKYNIKIKSNNFTKEYEVKKIMGLNGDDLKDVIKWKNLKDEPKIIEFFTVNLLYDINLIDFNNLEIFVVNKETNEETRII